MFRVYDFNVKNVQVDSSDGSDSDASGDNSDSEYAIKGVKNYYNRKFVIQILIQRLSKSGFHIPLTMIKSLRSLRSCLINIELDIL